MKLMTTQEIASAINATIIQGSGETICRGVSTDTRSILPDRLFIALIGPNFDAHFFLDQAVQKGAAALVVSRETALADKNIPVLLVQDTKRALQDLANYNRRQFDIPIVGVTGSIGKTTAKDMIASMLGVKYKTLKTTGNLNNEIGLPLTLLGLDASHRAAVVEMGMRGPGEIAELARIAEPTVAVITVIGETHLELLGSVEKIAQAKGEILDYIDEGKFAVLNGDDPWQRKMSSRARGAVTYYGLGAGVDVSAAGIKIENRGTSFRVETPVGSREMFIPVPGTHNVQNALAAVAVGWKLGLTLEEIALGLAGTDLTAMRLEVLEANGYTIINDAYNASPSSVKAALKTLKDLAGDGRTVAVLGNMYELGERTVPGHEEVGQEVARMGINLLITVGDYAAHIAAGAARHGMDRVYIYKCVDNNEAIKKLKGILTRGDTLLVKGSRGMKMEEIVNSFN